LGNDCVPKGDLLLAGAHGETLAALRTPALNHRAASFVLHPLAEPVGAVALSLLRLISALHGSDSSRFEKSGGNTQMQARKSSTRLRRDRDSAVTRVQTFSARLTLGNLEVFVRGAHATKSSLLICAQSFCYQRFYAQRTFLNRLPASRGSRDAPGGVNLLFFRNRETSK
jgi:hypothetical protein